MAKKPGDSSATIPGITYVNADKNKYMIYKDNRKKKYRLNNLISDKSYTGSSINLSGRFSNYYSLIY
jgi:hypothetical protein